MSGSAALGQIAISPADQVVIPVLGMHCAGGSLVARLMNLMGMELGWPLQPVGEDNPRGTWENRLFQMVNQQLLQGLGANVDAMDTPEGLQRFSQQIGRTVLSDADLQDLSARIGQNFMQPIWGWKDPRTAVTWPFWVQVLSQLGYEQVKPVIVVRHPDACFRSLQKQGVSRAQAAASGLSEEDFAHSMWWATYQVLIASELDESNTLIVCAEDLLDPNTAPTEVARLAAHMGVPAARCQVALEWLEFSGARRDPDPQDPNLASLYEGLCSLSQAQRSVFLQGKPRLPQLGLRVQPVQRAAQAQFCIYQVSPSGYPHGAAFDEVALGLSYGLQALGKNAPLVRRVEDIQGTPIVVGGNLLHDRFQNTYKIIKALPADTILFNLEQIDASSDWMTDAYLQLLKRFRVWDYSPGNIQRLATMGIAVDGLCRIGHARELERIDHNVKEDIDVLFYGGLNPRRQAVLQGLRERGLQVVVAANCFGEARDQLVARSKIVINIHYYPAKVLEIVRISYLLSNGQCVVSETGADPAEEQLFQSAIAFSTYEGLVDRCVDLVQDREQRHGIGRQAKALFSSMKQSDFLAELIQ
jgi:hypothetical protein